MLKILVKTDNPQIILASSSVYRKELLARLHLPFIAVAPDINESPMESESPEQTAMRLAKEKAEAIALRYPDSIVIGSDQVATLDGKQIGKPGNHARALEQLQTMRGQTVIFHTALCVLSNLAQHQKQSIQIQNCQTVVRFRNLSDTELDAYLQIEKPYDCAGSAKNEGLGIALLEQIQNDDPTALTGLPLIALTSMLRNLDVSFFK